MFPAEVGGWQKRQPVSGMDPLDLREVPLRMGFNTGIPGAPISAAGVSKLAVTGIRPKERPIRKNAGIVGLAYVGDRRFQAADHTIRLKSA